MGQRWETKRMTKTGREQEAVSEMETEMKWCNVRRSIENRRAAHRCSRKSEEKGGQGGEEIGGRKEKKERKKGWKPVQRADCPVHLRKGNNMASDSFAGPLKAEFITAAYLHAYGAAFFVFVHVHVDMCVCVCVFVHLCV